MYVKDSNSHANLKKQKISFLAGVLVLSSLFTIANIAISHAAYGGSCSDSTVTQTTDSVFGSNVEIFNPHSDNTRDTTCSFVVPSGVVAVDYLVVAGGGGGSSGGGGGGGVVTNRESRRSDGTVLATRRASLAVNPGDTITVVIGHGGGYCGGGSGGATGCSPSGVSSTDGGNSSFGSIVSTGGGGGGQYAYNVNNGRSGGSSGGANADAGSYATISPASTTAVGASSLGNSGGASTGSSYNAGAGGGGAGGAGGNNRTITSAGDAATGGSGGGGGNGGGGIVSDIRNSGTFSGTEFGCGGGGGINNNRGINISGAGGTQGCSNAGNGSSYGTRLNVQNNTDHFNGSSGTSGTGGGGGGTDPEDSRAGSGGSGIVIISYLVEDTQCPNDHSATPSSYPVACNTTVSIIAGVGSKSVDPRNAPISYSTSAISTATQITTIDSVTISISSNTFTFSVSNAQSSLVGGTYPMLYRLTQSSVDKYAYVLVNVADPNQHTPSRIPVDPRETAVNLPRILVGAPTAVLVCITPQSRNYARLVNVRLRSNVGGTTNSTPSTGALRMVGTRAAVQSNLSHIQITPNASDTRVIPGRASRFLTVNVSNTTVGGNNSCVGGTSSTIELFPIKLTQIRSFTAVPKNGRQNN